MICYGYIFFKTIFTINQNSQKKLWTIFWKPIHNIFRQTVCFFGTKIRGLNYGICVYLIYTRRYQVLATYPLNGNNARKRDLALFKLQMCIYNNNPYHCNRTWRVNVNISLAYDSEAHFIIASLADRSPHELAAFCSLEIA